jgi:ABC-2 type transport system permease protein
MSEPHRELVIRGAATLRRATLWWGLGIAVLTITTTAFWPSLEGGEALQSFDDMGAVLEAFGAQNMATPAGYLDGQMFAIMLPLLLSGMAIAELSALTSGDEDAGRLEFLHALPVSRQAVWLGRWLAATLMLLAVTVATALVMVMFLPIFSFEEVSPWSVIAATLGCAALAAFHAAVAFAAGAFGSRRGTAVAASVCVLVAGYVLGLLAPLVEGLGWTRKLSPWYWALGEQPVSNGLQPAWLTMLIAVTAVLVVIGTRAIRRRDIRTA